MWEVNPLWLTLRDGEREMLSREVEMVHYAKHDIIHCDGDEAGYMWMLLKGKVRIYKEGIGQRQQIIRLLKPYDIFGYRACIAGEPYNSSASAFEECTVYRLSRERFVELVRGNGALCYEVMLMMAKDLAFSEIQTVNLTPNMSNMTTSNAIRTLSQFAQEGLIAVEGRHIQVLNEKELEHISRLG